MRWTGRDWRGRNVSNEFTAGGGVVVVLLVVTSRWVMRDGWEGRASAGVVRR